MYHSGYTVIAGAEEVLGTFLLEFQQRNYLIRRVNDNYLLGYFI